MHPVDASLPKLACQGVRFQAGRPNARAFLIIDADFLKLFQIIGIAAKRAGLAVHSALRQRSDVPIESSPDASGACEKEDRHRWSAAEF